ncbi:hypothetical protein QBC46DRAFT_230201, partial [Diplogelasinospora grovesii]
SPDEVEKRLGLYEKIRRNRASAIQILSNVGQGQPHLVYEELKQYLREADIPTCSKDPRCFTFGYDVAQGALEAMKEHDNLFEL